MPSKNYSISARKLSTVCNKAVFNYSFVVLFALLFSWVQFSAFANIQRSNSSSGYAVLHATSTANSVQLTAGFPFESLPLGQEMELLEEDETKNNLDEYWDQVAGKYHSGVLHNYITQPVSATQLIASQPALDSLLCSLSFVEELPGLSHR
jgi:hypothetical protein